eukprot:scaffold128014_cov33-Cyclotella_meneghiniana.AAC.1
MASILGLSTDGHGTASILGDFDRRWPWLKCQVDGRRGQEQSRPPHNTLFSRGPPRKRRVKCLHWTLALLPRPPCE